MGFDVNAKAARDLMMGHARLSRLYAIRKKIAKMENGVDGLRNAS
jgi:hypothetical protein